MIYAREGFMGCSEECMQKRKENSIVVHLTFSVDPNIPLVAFSVGNLSKDKCYMKLTLPFIRTHCPFMSVSVCCINSEPQYMMHI